MPRVPKEVLGDKAKNKKKKTNNAKSTKRNTRKVSKKKYY